MEKFKNFKNYLNFINFVGFGILVYFSWIYQSQIYNLVNTGLLFRYITAFNYYFLILECLFYLSKLNVNSTKNSIIYFILITAIAEGFSSSLSSVTYINERTMLILLPVALVIIMSTINLSITDKFFIYFMPLILISLCFVKKLQQPYEWWGYKEQPISTKSFSTNIPGLKGIKFSKEEAKLYEEMVKVIESNSTSETTILGYPYVQIFSVLTNHTEINRFVPVYFYDVCPDEMAIEDAKRLKETPPDIIIYMDIPGCMHEHEQIYRNGSECGQREIVKFIKDGTENNYSLIGQIANLYVFKDLKGKKPNYTYIEDNDISQIFDDIK
jgi:hypothetical protein